MSPGDASPSHRAVVRRALAILACVCLVATGCSDDGDATDLSTPDGQANTGPLPSITGGVELRHLDPSVAYVGAGLGFGTPLPSEVAAAEAYAVDPEVAAVDVRRVLSRRDGRLVGSALAITLDGAQVFDAPSLDAFVEATVGALGGGDIEAFDVAGQAALRSVGPAGTAIGFRRGDLFMVVRGPVEADTLVVVQRQVAAMDAGAPGQVDPFTPLIATPADAAFVPVPTVEFQVIPPPEQEPPPETPSLAGAAGPLGRYGVVAGERRSTVWAFAADVAARPSAESMAPDASALVSARAAGAPAESREVIDRVVIEANGPDGQPSARAFRHQGLVLLVEGPDPAQLDAIVADWITVLGTESTA